MLAFVLRRIGQAVLVMLAVGLIAFSLFTFVGDPVLFMLGQDATPEDRVRVTKLLGLDQPVPAAQPKRRRFTSTPATEDES